MTEALGILAQIVPGATMTDAYTVPAGKSAGLSSVVVCPLGPSTTFRLSLAKASAPDDPKQYLNYDTPVTAGLPYVATIGVALGPNDTVRVQSPGQVAVNILGVEVT